MTWVRHMVCVGEKRGAHRVLVRKPEGKNYSEHLCVERSIILRKADLQEIGRSRETDWSASGQGQVTGFCENCNEPSNSINYGKFLD